MADPVNPAVDPEVPQPATPVPASDIIAKPSTSDAVNSLYAASNTQNQFTEPTFGTTAPKASLVDPEVLAMQQQASNTTTSDFLGTVPKPVIGDGVVDAQLASNTDSEAFTTGNNFGTTYGEFGEASTIAGLTDSAQLQPTIATQQRNVNGQDWRVRLRLAPGSNYLYNSEQPGILQPLRATDGIIFPYTPSIDTSYKANYEPYDLVHSNYRGYFYKNSYIDAVNLRCMFTAQDTYEANYLLAVIHFFRSVTKMFYGQDAQRGSPPPLVYLSGLGEYQFNEHSCVISQFSYNLPAEVDYIRAGSPNVNNTNLLSQRARNSSIAGGILGSIIGGAIQRLATAGLPQGGITAPPGPPTLGTSRPTYVPTKMEISISLLPIQSRQQVSKQFSLKSFASGDLLKGGFW